MSNRIDNCARTKPAQETEAGFSRPLTAEDRHVFLKYRLPEIVKTLQRIVSDSQAERARGNIRLIKADQA